MTAIPKCENNECTNDCAKSVTTGKYTRFCSTKCKCTVNSRKGQEKREKTCIERYGAKSILMVADVREQIKSTLLERYGVTHPMHSDTIKKKLDQTKEERYGDSKYNNREKFTATMAEWDDEKRIEIDTKRKTTVLERYGVEYTTQSEQMKSRSKETNLQRYGVENASQSPEIIEKIKRSHIEKYGAYYQQQHISSDSLTKLSDINYLRENASRSLKEIAIELGVTYYTVGYWYEKLNVVRTFDNYNKSLAESEINEFIKSHGYTTITNCRDILKRKEIDIYIPELKLGIEYNGLYWHCESNISDKHYHSNKMRECNEFGITLMQITDYEFINTKEKVLSRISSKLGVNNKIYARNTTVKTLSANECSDFLDENHIQGSVNSSIKLGLYHEDILVAVMTFGKSRYNSKYEYELLRYSNLLNTNVIGGASKLFKYFITTYNPTSIISYCDLRWNTGNMYEKIGFKYTHTTEPNYWYTYQYCTLESRVKYQKHKLSKLLPIFDPELSEWENMVNNKYDRIWDCGNSVWEWTK